MKKYVLISAFALLLFSCSEENLDLEISANKDATLNLEDDQALREYLKNGLNISQEERIAIERSKGFTSYGSRQDEIYAFASTQTLQSENEMDAFVEKYNQYLTWNTLENGNKYLVRKYANDPIRYIMNQDRMWKVCDEIFTFDQNNVQNLSDANHLKEIDLTDYRQSRARPIIIDSQCGDTMTKAQYNDKQMTVSTVEVRKSHLTDHVYASLTAQSYKRAFRKYWPVKRTLRGYLSFVATYFNGTGWRSFSGEEDFFVEADRFDAGYVQVGVLQEIPSGVDPDPVFSSFYAFADSPATATNLFECKKEQVCQLYECPPADIDPCAGITCSNGEFCENGTCIDLCYGVHCAAGYMCVNGSCIPDPNYGGCPNVRCPPGTICAQGTCIEL